MNVLLRGAVPGLLLITLLSACGAKSEKAATQVAAKVNNSEISVHQINFVLQRANVKPEQQEAARGQALERLIDQELAVQKATEKKLDRSPEVLQQLEAAKREILQRAYLEGLVQDVPKPSETEVKDYYAAHPELFSNRRIYSYRALGIQMPADKIPVVQDMLAKNKSLEEIVAWTKEQNLRAVADGATKPAEQMPMQLLPRLSQLKDGQVVLLTGNGGVELIQLVQSKSEPVDQARATPAIQQYFVSMRKNERLQKEVKHLRDEAKLEYVGGYKPPVAASAPVAAPASAAPAATGSAVAADLEKGIATGIK
ncbi:EpsD family peptidyl-prolyl cis-trans isomerase [Uliginosibacterium sp. H3]|uniref:EpsD family peptidyl-prolyl cis-trans isomerase n=1 Tax=Uliginosibacterium silvisoli TaxID=3114758 RepID=A0ABU6JXP9_9RHOO|nr:EpsD family peptidyl-prolyl cis-trans isomerase [Uliginosibacterium sp. H3]